MNTKSTPYWRTLASCICFYFWLGSFTSLAQAQQLATAPPKQVFTMVEQPPQFPGGSEAYQNYIQTKVRQLKDSTGQKLKGKVYVSFIVTAQGAIEAAKALNRHQSAEAREALRLVEGMPAWTPGRQGGRAVHVQYNLPIVFSGK